jgi:hypothetical protein
MAPSGLPPVLLGAFSPTQAVELGIGVRALRRLRVEGLLEEDPLGLLRLVEPVLPERIALAAMGGPAALCGVTAAAFYGWAMSETPDAVHVAVPPWRKPTCWPYSVVHRRMLPDGDLVTVDGASVTSPTRTALDVAASERLADALVMLDDVLRRRILDRRHLEDGLTTRTAARGRCRQAEAVRLADGRRASVPESVFRALVHEAGLPAPVSQFTVTLHEVFVGRVDFAWPGRRVIVEIDGFAYHSDMASFVRDHRRQNQLVEAGWRVLRFAAIDLRSRPDEVVAEVRAALALPLPRRAR